jgi:hypothetical protein
MRIFGFFDLLTAVTFFTDGEKTNKVIVINSLNKKRFIRLFLDSNKDNEFGNSKRARNNFSETLCSFVYLIKTEIKQNTNMSVIVFG